MSNWVQIRKVTRSNSIYKEFQNQCVVILTKRGDAYIMGEAYEQLGKPEYITLHEDAKAHQFGLRPATADTMDAFKVTHGNARNETPRIAIKAYTETRNLIVKDRSAVYRARLDDTGCLVIDMNQRPIVL